MDKPQKKLNKLQTKALLPVMKAFNKMAKGFINLLTKKVQEKEKKLANIKVMVNEITVPVKQHNLSIQTVDINKTVVKKKGELSYTQSMSWEDEVKRKKRGMIL